MKKGHSIIIVLFLILLSSCGDNNKYLKGVEPSAITATFKAFKFKTDRTFDAEYGNLWNITGEDVYSTYNIQLFSQNSVSEIESITVNALLKKPKGEIDYSLFHEMAMQTKEECDPSIVSNWLSAHYNNPGDTIINQVSFSMSQPSELAKTLTIKKVVIDITE